MDLLDDVIDGADRPEFHGRDFLAGDFLEFDDQVDGIDAVEVKVFEQAGIRGDILGRDFEKFDKVIVKLLIDVLATVHDYPSLPDA
jgi:hypothetical protein|tara:strand:- start:202 stop:459 length:258 start_codon:yes stop_codon:yes gene_type:complete